MELPAIDIDAVPLLDTVVGLFGSLAAEGLTPSASVFESGVIVIMIIYD